MGTSLFSNLQRWSDTTVGEVITTKVDDPQSASEIMSSCVCVWVESWWSESGCLRIRWLFDGVAMIPRCQMNAPGVLLYSMKEVSFILIF